MITEIKQIHDFKYFVPGKTVPRDIVFLRKLVSPLKLEWMQGAHKNTMGVYGVCNTDNKVTGDPIESDLGHGILFWGMESPKDFPIDLFSNSINGMYFSVQLLSGQKLQIIPATAIPRKISLLRSAPKILNYDNCKRASLYNRDSSYGDLAFSLIWKVLEKKESFTTSDEGVMDLIRLGLTYSYSLPLDVINACVQLADVDLVSLFLACMGVEDFKHFFTEVDLEESTNT